MPRLAVEITESGLAEQTEFGYRIRGTVGRIEWLNRRRDAARINGAMGGRKPNSANPLSPALSPSPSPSQGTEESGAPHDPRSADAPATTKPPTLTDPEAVLTYPVHGKERVWHLKPTQVEEWSALYPTLDVVQECRNALAHFKAKGLKTHRGMPTALVSWLNRSVGYQSRDAAAARRDGAYVAPRGQAKKPDAATEAYAKRFHEVEGEERASGKHADEGQVRNAVLKRLIAERAAGAFGAARFVINIGKKPRDRNTANDAVAEMLANLKTPKKPQPAVEA